MSKAEEAALKAYPVHNVGDATLPYGEWDLNGVSRRGFQEGYEQAEKDMKERFIQFVHRHYPINYTGWIQDFQRAMEDEK